MPARGPGAQGGAPAQGAALSLSQAFAGRGLASTGEQSQAQSRVAGRGRPETRSSLVTTLGTGVGTAASAGPRAAARVTQATPVPGRPLGCASSGVQAPKTAFPLGHSRGAPGWPAEGSHRQGQRGSVWPWREHPRLLQGPAEAASPDARAAGSPPSQARSEACRHPPPAGLSLPLGQRLCGAPRRHLAPSGGILGCHNQWGKGSPTRGGWKAWPP